MTPPGASEVWQARIDPELAAQLRADSTVLGLRGRTDIVKAALRLLHQRAAEERMARSVEEFYGGDTPPLPIGVRPAATASNREEIAEGTGNGIGADAVP